MDVYFVYVFDFTFFDLFDPFLYFFRGILSPGISIFSPGFTVIVFDAFVPGSNFITNYFSFHSIVKSPKFLQKSNRSNDLEFFCFFLIL